MLLRCVLLCSLSLAGWQSRLVAQMPTPARIQRAAQATLSDWGRTPDFDYCVSVRKGEQTRTYIGSMLEGSPFEQLVAVDGVPVAESQLREESTAIAAERLRRSKESPEQRDQRIAQYHKQLEHYFVLLRELPKAFQFEESGSATIGTWQTDLFRVIPRPGYRPRGIETQVLTGMQGTLWMDRNSDHWIRAEAEVVRPVPIVGFVARVERGTRFLLEDRPAVGNVWLSSHFELHTKARILFLFSRTSTEDYTYFHYAERGTLKPAMCLPSSQERPTGTMP